MIDRTVRIPAGGVRLEGELSAPEHAIGVVLFAHGSGSSRHSPRNQYVAKVIRDGGLATLLFDLLTTEEESVDRFTRHHRFDISLLASRLIDATRWLKTYGALDGISIGYFGASTGAAAALVAAAELGREISAVVSRGGRPDLAGEALGRVTAPTLLVVGGSDEPVIEMNKEAQKQLRSETRLEIVPGATHLFEEPGALDEVARLAKGWFVAHLRPRAVGQAARHH